jgi:hypothetical protein
LKKGKQLVLEAIQVSMEAQGWPLQSLCGLVPSYAKDTLVTPYFYCTDVLRRPLASYLVDGVIGVVHQGFEKFWMENPAREPKEPGFGVLLHIANFRELGGKRYIPCDVPFAKEVDTFCAAVANILGQMPADEQQLIAAFEKDELYGFRVDAFAGYSHRKKFQAFKEFVKQLAADTSGR